MRRTDDEWLQLQGRAVRASRLIEYGAKAHRFNGMRRWVRMTALRAGCCLMGMHRRAWLLGLLHR
jgi:hypothetical protein